MPVTSFPSCSFEMFQRAAGGAALLGLLFEGSALAQEGAPRAPSAGSANEVPAPQSSTSPFAPGEERLLANHPLDPSKSVVKPGTGFVFQSADGLFSFDPRLRAQFLYELDDDEGEDAAESVQIRRARLQFKGNFYGKDNKYKVEFAVSPGDVAQNDNAGPATSILLDWYLDFTQLRDLSLRVGQYRCPSIGSASSRRVTSSSSTGRSSTPSSPSIEISASTCDRRTCSASTAFATTSACIRERAAIPGGFYDFGMMYLARVEVLPLGMFDDYAEGDLERLSSPKLSIGVAAARLNHARFNRGILGSAPSGGGTTDFNALSADAVFRYAGFSATTEWIFRDGDGDFGADGDLEGPRDGFGGMGQVTYLFPTPRIQVGSRYGIIRRQGEASVLPESDELGGGVSYYFAHHPFELQADYFRLAEEDEVDTVYSHRVRVQLQAGS